MPQKRTAYFVSDGTGITAEMLGHSLLAQFEGLEVKQVRMPFVNTAEKARECVRMIGEVAARDGKRPIVFTTLVNQEISAIFQVADALVLELFETFIGPLEQELGLGSTHTMGRARSVADSTDYKNRIEAINFTLGHDDGVTDKGLGEADVILVGVSRSGKTPTSLYLAMQYGIKAANYPLIPEDFERNRLPEALTRYRSKLFGLTITPERLTKIRSERLPESKYASLSNCRAEVDAAERLMRRENIRWLDSTTKSIEEISATIMQEIKTDQD